MKKINYWTFFFVLISLNVFAKSSISTLQSNNLVDEAQTSADTIYSCTMHPEVKSLQPGECSKCGMELVPSVYEKVDSTKSVSADNYYTCSMHPEVHSDKPGSCPKCGMELVKKSEVSNSKHGMMGMGMMMDSPWFMGMGIIMVIVMAVHFVK